MSEKDESSTQKPVRIPVITPRTRMLAARGLVHLDQQAGVKTPDWIVELANLED